MRDVLLASATVTSNLLVELANLPAEHGQAVEQKHADRWHALENGQWNSEQCGKLLQMTLSL